MANNSCRICGTNFDTEKALKKHARTVHDCSIFAAQNPAFLAVSEETNKNDVAKVLKLSGNKHLPVTMRYVVLYRGSWLPLKDVPETLHEYARSIAKTVKEDKEQIEIMETETGFKVIGQPDKPEIEVEIIEPEASSRTVWKPPVISYSMVKQFLDCEQSWFYAYIDKIVPRVPNPKLDKGTLVHLALEHAWHAVHAIEFSKENTKVALKKARIAMKEAILAKLNAFIEDRNLLQEEADEATETAQTALDVARKAFPTLYKKYCPLDIEGIPAVEYQFTFPIKRLALYHGTIDILAVERATGLVWLMDYKTRSAFQPVENQEFNLQMASYQYGLLHYLGVETAGSLTYEIWHEPPKEPGLLKDKKRLSTAQIRSDWATYKKVIEKHGFNEADYIEMKNKLASVEWFREGKAFRNTNEINQIWERVLFPAIEKMVKAMKAHTRTKFEPQRKICSLNTSCPSCPYKHLCMESLRGQDVSEILKDFTRNSYLDKYEELV